MLAESFSTAPSARVNTAPVIHLSAREGRSLVFFSQVAKSMSFLAHHGADITIAMICQLAVWAERAIQAVYAAFRGGLHLSPASIGPPKEHATAAKHNCTWDVAS